MKEFEHLTTWSQLLHWEQRARKNERALIAAHPDIRNYLATATEIRAVERDGFLVLKKLRCPLKPQHAPTSTIATPISQGSAALSGGSGLVAKYQPKHITSRR